MTSQKTLGPGRYIDVFSLRFIQLDLKSKSDRELWEVINNYQRHLFKLEWLPKLVLGGRKTLKN